MRGDDELLQIAGTFQRVLSGGHTEEDLAFCRTLTPLQELMRSSLIPGESEDQGFDRITRQLQKTQALTSLARPNGEYFDASGRCRSAEGARAFIDASLSALDRSRLAPKNLFCGRAQVTKEGWNNFTVRHDPNYGVWTLQLVCHGELDLAWDETGQRCHAGDIVVIPPQAYSVHRAAPDCTYYDEFWFHFSGSSRWLQWLDWVPGLSRPAINRGAGQDQELAELSARIVALNGSTDKLHQQLQESMFEQLLIRQRMRQGPTVAEKTPDHAEAAKNYILDHVFDPMSLEDIALHCGLSCSHLSDVFKAATGSSPMQWRERERLHKAGEMLYNSNLRVLEVAALTGYEDYRHFAKRFKAVTGLTPSNYRKQYTRPWPGAHR